MQKEMWLLLALLTVMQAQRSSVSGVSIAPCSKKEAAIAN
jgi:hypothetical protein